MTSSRVSANTTASGGAFSSQVSVWPCCSRTASAVESFAPNRAARAAVSPATAAAEGGRRGGAGEGGFDRHRGGIPSAGRGRASCPAAGPLGNPLRRRGPIWTSGSSSPTLTTRGCGAPGAAVGRAGGKAMARFSPICRCCSPNGRSSIASTRRRAPAFAASNTWPLWVSGGGNRCRDCARFGLTQVAVQSADGRHGPRASAASPVCRIASTSSAPAWRKRSPMRARSAVRPSIVSPAFRRPQTKMAEARRTLIENLRYAADRLGEAGRADGDGAAQPLRLPGYFVTHSGRALDIIDETGSTNVKLQYDVYHMQRMEGELAATIEQLLPRIGHIQIAGNPGRHEPTSARSTSLPIRAPRRARLRAGWGPNTKPKGRTEDGLGWFTSCAPRAKADGPRRRVRTGAIRAPS